MSPDIRDNAVPLLRPAAVAVRAGTAENIGLEFIDSFEDGHPPFLDGLDAQTEISAEFSVRFSDKSCGKKLLFRRAQPEYRRPEF